MNSRRSFKTRVQGQKPKREKPKEQAEKLERAQKRKVEKYKDRQQRRSSLQKNQKQFENNLIRSFDEEASPKTASSGSSASIPPKKKSMEAAVPSNPRPPKDTQFVEGRVDLHPDGFGFLIPKDPLVPNIYLPEETLKTVMHRDEVKVSVTDRYDSGAKLRGQVVAILKHSQKEFIGAIRFFKGGALCIPLEARNRKFAFRIENLPEHFQHLKPGSAVLCKILRYPSETPATAEILDHIEDPESASQDTLKIVVASSWPRFFSKEAVTEAEQRAQAWKDETASDKDRKDIRALPLVTIDGRDARDFDDAVCASYEASSKNIRLWVAIADVSLFVKHASRLDREAYERSTSVYFPDFVVPMLPEVLSNGVCSLNPFEERACMVCEMLINANGEVDNYKFYKGLMQSKRRLTYEQMQAFMDKESWAQSELFNLKDSLEALQDAFGRLLQAKTRRGAIDLDIPEAGVSLDKSGQVIDIQARVRLSAHRLIEECMLVANQCAAHFIHENKDAGIYRIHEVPDSRKIDDLMNFLEISAISMVRFEQMLRKKNKKRSLDDLFQHPGDFQSLLQFVQGELDLQSPVLKAINILLLRSMKQAKYSTQKVGHFALATQDYTHFTSPIRRYPDLLVHRLIKEALDKKRAVDFISLENQAQHCSDQERLAMDMERKLIDTKKCRYIEAHLGEEFEAWVSGLTEKGLFCQIEGHFVDGLVSADLVYKASQHSFNPDLFCYVGPNKSRISLGTKVRIQVAAVHLETRRIDFLLKQVHTPLHN